MATFTPEEISSLHWHLGFPDANSVSSAMVGSREIYANIQTRLRDLNEGMRPRILRVIALMDEIENEMVSCMGDARVEKVGSINLRSDAFTNLAKQYDAWGAKLGTQLNVPYNPYAKRSLHQGGGPGGINARWNG